jgi:uncharacterized protein (TIGR02145 family)
MKNLVAVLFAVLSLNALSQIPDYVPTDGLVAWYPFDQNFQDESDFGNDAVENGSVPFTDDRFQNGESALSFSGNGNNFLRVNYSSDSYTFESGFSASVWFISNTSSGNRRVFSMGSTDASGKGFHVMKYSNEIGAWFCEGPGDPYFGNWDGNENTTFDIGEWNHLLFSCDFGNLNWTVFLNGDSVNGGTSGFDFDPNQLPVIFTQTFEIGRKSGTSNSGDAWNGVIDDLGIWSRPLTALEAEALYISFNGIGGCTDSTACNYDASANWNDGTCVPSGCMDPEACNYNANAECEGESCDYTCCPGPGCCGAGTVWSWESQTCVVATPAYLNDPGETAVLNPCYFDTNYDGLVEVTDLMNLLSVYNMSCFWQCGDRMSYQGYDYQTVQIGEQCWFAENLQNANYSNGEVIPNGLDDVSWGTTTDGAMTAYGAGASTCYNYDLPNGDACDETVSVPEYGRLYNWHAVADERGLCPTGWHVPSDLEWMNLEMQLGMASSDANGTGWRGTDQGTQLKNSEGWFQDGNGSNSSGFSGLPAGDRTNSVFVNAGAYGTFWSSTEADEATAWKRFIGYDDERVFRTNFTKQSGFSIRCIQNSDSCE